MGSIEDILGEITGSLSDIPLLGSAFGSLEETLGSLLNFGSAKK